MRRSAFTLLELLIVLAIITTLFGLGYSSFRRQMARSQFKSGVFELQIDLARTRLLAMKTGTPYLFRFASGSGVYEIAPVKTLQETIYRQNGDFGNASDPNGAALGGSLIDGASGSATVFGDDSFSGSEGSTGDDAFNGRLYSTVGGPSSRFSDDLFSPENVAADVASFRAASSFRSNVVSFGGDVGNGIDVGGGLGTPALPGVLETSSTSGAEWNAVSTDWISNGLGVSEPTTVRDLNADEKSFATEGLIAWRVNGDGAIFRKELTGDVVFTFERISKSTPLNLKTRRPDGLNASNGGAASGDESATGAEKLGSELTGSLSRPPASNGASRDDVSASFDGTGNADVSGSLDFFNGANGFDGAASLDSVWSEPIVFYPNGRTSTAVLGLVCVGDYRFYSEIALRGMTGVARVSAISSLAPGVDPTASALSQEELFRLTNPGASPTTSGTDSTTNGALEPTETLGDSIGALSNGSLGDVSSGDVAPDENESSSRRSGYRFDVAPNPSANAAAPVGVSSGVVPRNAASASSDAIGGGAL